MPSWLIWSLAGVVVLVLLDRMLLWMESNRWINYRRSKIRGSGSVYHMLEMQSVFDPGAKQIMEIKYQEQVEEKEDSGDPPGPDPDDPPSVDSTNTR